MSSFFEYVGQCMPQLTLGLKLTLQMTVFSLILAVVVGMVMCLFSISKVKPLNWISGIYLSLIRGTPLMVQAFFIYFGITGALHIRITSFSAAILVLCLNAGAYLSEIFRSGIAAVNKGQMEAARSLGFSGSGSFSQARGSYTVTVSYSGTLDYGYEDGTLVYSVAVN